MPSPNAGLSLIRFLALSIIAVLGVSGRPAAAQPYASTTLVTANPSVVAAGGQVTFSVSVAFNNTTGQTDVFPPTPSGQVQLYNTSVATGCSVSNQLFATVTLSGGVGSAVINAIPGAGVFCATSGVSGVNHISAIYVADPTSPYLSSTGTTALNITASLTTTSTTIPTASVNPVPSGQSVTVSAYVNVVKVTSPYPSGSMNFLIAANCNTPGATILGTAPVQVNGTGAEVTFLASIVVTAGTVAPGAVQIVACYLGDGNYQASSSPAPLSLVFSGPTLNQSTVSVSASLPPPISIPAAQPITLYGQVTSIGGTIPDGEQVTFYDNGATIGAGSTLNGQASMTVAFNSLGAHSITASYPGDANNAQSTSAALSITVLARTTTTSLTVSPNPANANSALQFSATVTPPSATGNVTLTSNSQPLGSAPVANGVATFILANGLPAGNYTEAASFSPSPTDLIDTSSDSLPVSLVVNPPSTTPTALSVSIVPQSPVVGQSVTSTITITGATGLPGSNESVTVTVTSSTGTATFTVPLNSAWQAQVTNSYHSGPLSFTASYGGDPSNQGSTGSAQATVGLGLTTTSVSDTPAPSTFGQTATLTVKVAPVAPAMGTPTGSVSLTSDGNPIGTVNLSGGTATLPYSGLAAGTHTIGATYPGDGDFASSTGQTSQMVAPSNTSIAFTSSPNPSVFGQPVTLTATVSAVAPGAGTPSGTVVIADGSNSSSFVLSNGIATWTTSSLSAGPHNLTATYGASPNFNSSSATLTQSVNTAGTKTTVTSSANPAGTLQSITFTGTITVNSPGMGVPTGTLTFMDGTNTLCANVTVTGGTGRCTSNPLPAGTHTITVTYSGDANFQQSSTIYSEIVTTSQSGNPYLVIRKSVDDRYLPSGDTTEYVITISNRGSGAAAGIAMTDPLPPGIIIGAVSQVAGHGTCTAPPAGQTGAIACSVPNLPAGGTWGIAVRVKVTAPSGTTVTNTASFTSVTPNAAPGPYSSSAVINVLRRDH